MRSMTAYASVHKRKKNQSVQIILRSSNFKYLDVFTHGLPPEDILLEEKIKRQIKKNSFRGKIEAFIFMTKPQAKNIYIDEATVAKYILQTKALSKKYKLKYEIGMSDILNLPQAISWEQKGRGDDQLVMTALKDALGKFSEFKRREGKVIKKEMVENITKLKSNIRKIKKQKPKIKKDENGKEDIDEEISLMSFYVNKLEDRINSKKSEPLGKSIDFLTLEILRELNASSSKTKKKGLALLIVEAKNYLERIREQAQNVE
jgi:uncharacterized protein (TIGR00255 family)